jgi:hypothetical protein
MTSEINYLIVIWHVLLDHTDRQNERKIKEYARFLYSFDNKQQKKKHNHSKARSHLSREKYT